MSVTINLPGAFETSFSGGGIAQGQVSDDAERALYEAWKAARHIRRGRGYSIRLELPEEHALDNLHTLHLQAEVTIIGVRDNLPAWDHDDDVALRTELRAAQAVMRRCEELIAVLEMKGD